MAADVVEAPERARLVAHHHDRVAGDRIGDPAARIGQRALVGQELPGAGEDAGPLGRERRLAVVVGGVRRLDRSQALAHAPAIAARTRRRQRLAKRAKVRHMGRKGYVSRSF
jgi:hypothetical protein